MDRAAIDLETADLASRLAENRGSPQHGFDTAATEFSYSMRDALKKLDTVCDFLRESQDVRDRVRSLGGHTYPEMMINFLDLQCEHLKRARTRVEMQLFGREL